MHAGSLRHCDTNALTPSLDHWYEHIMVIQHVILRCLKQGHARKDSHSQSRNDKMNLAEGQTGPSLVSTHSNTEKYTRATARYRTMTRGPA